MTTKAKTRRTRAHASPQDAGRPAPRVIRKYPNRRLYDTVESRYITLADVRRLVLERVEFVVIDKKTDEDITAKVLAQIILDLDATDDPLHGEQERGVEPRNERGRHRQHVLAPAQDASAAAQSPTIVLNWAEGLSRN